MVKNIARNLGLNPGPSDLFSSRIGCQLSIGLSSNRSSSLNIGVITSELLVAIGWKWPIASARWLGAIS